MDVAGSRHCTQSRLAVPAGCYMMLRGFGGGVSMECRALAWMAYRCMLCQVPAWHLRLCHVALASPYDEQMRPGASEADDALVDQAQFVRACDQLHQQAGACSQQHRFAPGPEYARHL